MNRIFMILIMLFLNIAVLAQSNETKMRALQLVNKDSLSLDSADVFNSYPADSILTFILIGKKKRNGIRWQKEPLQYRVTKDSIEIISTDTIIKKELIIRHNFYKNAIDPSYYWTFELNNKINTWLWVDRLDNCYLLYLNEKKIKNNKLNLKMRPKGYFVIEKSS